MTSSIAAWSAVLLAASLGVVQTGCRSRVGSGVYVGPRGYGGPGHIRMRSDENVHEKRHEWFQGLYRQCVNGHQANACFKTGQNIEDGVVAPPNVSDAHWFYAKACDLEDYDMYCHAADRTMPEEPGDHHHDDDHHHDSR